MENLLESITSKIESMSEGQILLIPVIFGLICFVVWLCIPIIPAKIAARKGYSKGGFWVFGFFMFIPALLVAMFIPDKYAGQSGYGGQSRYPGQNGYAGQNGYSGQSGQAGQSGHAVPAQSNSAPALYYVCPKCGLVYSTPTSFCPACGARIE
ncbi:MAG: hypothetical protein LBN99_05210 [Oscillospiraceae bacterium]|jgi:hypothetical protein|nr:hypothetical protein [Oscillospiraceae bacterium]